MGCEVRRAHATVELPFPPRRSLPVVGGMSRYALRLSCTQGWLAVWLYFSCKHRLIFQHKRGLKKEGKNAR